MKKITILILSIISAVLLIGSFPLKLIAESIVVDICRLVGFILIFVVSALRISQKDKSEKEYDGMKKLIKLKLIVLSIITSLIATIFQGIQVNSQKINGLNTLSSGFPLTYFEFYYPNNTEPTIGYIIQNINTSNFKIDILILVINIIFFYSIFLCIRKFLKTD